MQSVFAIVLVFAVAVNAGGLYLQAPSIVRVHTPAQVITPVIHTAHSTSYKIRAPAAKIITTPVLSAPVLHAAPVHTYSHGLPLVHTMSHGVLLH